MSLLSRINNPATLDLRLYQSSQDYFERCDVDVRTSFNKCKKLHYTVAAHTSIDEYKARQLYHVWTSLPKRQNRPINLNYELLSGQTTQITPNKWPIEKYDDNNLMFIMETYDINEHTYEFIKESPQYIAYLELCVEGKIAIVHSTLGHGDYLKYGIMKTLFYEVTKRIWNDVDQLVYGPKSELNFFKKDLLFK